MYISIKYSEVGFRAFYNNFIAVPIKDNLKELEALVLAKNNEKDLSGIVINAFS